MICNNGSEIKFPIQTMKKKKLFVAYQYWNINVHQDIQKREAVTWAFFQGFTE